MRKFTLIICAAVISLYMNGCKNTQQATSVDSKKSTAENAESSQLANNSKNLIGKYWKLIELRGNPVTYAADNAKEVHIIFKAEENQFNGNAGCNTIIGSYELKGLDRIVISPTVSTLKMCLDMETETQFLEVLKMTDSYAARNDTLSLHRARMAPLARFVAVYLQ